MHNLIDITFNICEKLKIIWYGPDQSDSQYFAENQNFNSKYFSALNHLPSQSPTANAPSSKYFCDHTSTPPVGIWSILLTLVWLLSNCSYWSHSRLFQSFIIINLYSKVTISNFSEIEGNCSRKISIQRHRKRYILLIFFCDFTAPRPALGHYRGNCLFHLILITLFFLVFFWVFFHNHSRTIGIALF